MPFPYFSAEHQNNHICNQEVVSLLGFEEICDLWSGGQVWDFLFSFWWEADASCITEILNLGCVPEHCYFFLRDLPLQQTVIIQFSFPANLHSLCYQLILVLTDK